MSRVASASAGSMTPTSIFGSVGSGSLKGISLLPHLGFQSFKPFQSFQPPPSSSPRDAGEERGGGLNGLNVLNDWNVFISRFHLRQISRQITLHHFVLVVRRVAGGRWFPDAFAAHAAVFGFSHADQSFFRHGVD